MRLDDLGSSRTVQAFRGSRSASPYGAILVTGPTGSGKSTTLYATLNILNDADRNIITVEDPVEYRLPGVNQIQVNTKAGLTFASALRSILRADPDIVLIGEIRDRETALIAVEAALTGHLVLSTLHTNDAPLGHHAAHRDGRRDVPRGVGGRLRRRAASGAQALRAVPGRLPAPNSPGARGRRISRSTKMGGHPRSFSGPRGARRAPNTGYRGRVGLYEVMQMSEEE